MNSYVFSGLSFDDANTLIHMNRWIKEVPDNDLDELLALGRTEMLAQLYFMDLNLSDPIINSLLVPIEFLQELPRNLKEQAAILQRKSTIVIKELVLNHILETDFCTDYKQLAIEMLSS